MRVEWSKVRFVVAVAPEAQSLSDGLAERKIFHPKDRNVELGPRQIGLIGTVVCQLAVVIPGISELDITLIHNFNKGDLRQFVAKLSTMAPLGISKLQAVVDRMIGDLERGQESKK